LRNLVQRRYRADVPEFWKKAGAEPRRDEIECCEGVTCTGEGSEGVKEVKEVELSNSRNALA
jgi:hypothetical protein